MGEQSFSEAAMLRSTNFLSLTSALNDEYQNLLKENHEQRLKIAELKRELSQALYENQASKRVIARLLRGMNENDHPDTVDIDRNDITLSSLQKSFLEVSKRINREIKRNSYVNQKRSEEIFNQYDSYTIKCINSIFERQHTITSVDSNIGNCAILGTSDGSVVVFDVLSTSFVQVIDTNFDDSIVAIESSRDQSEYLVCSENGKIAIYHKNAENPKYQFQISGVIVNASWHPLGKHIIVFLQNGNILVLSVPLFEEVLKICTEPDITIGKVHPNGSLIAVALENHTFVQLWNFSSSTSQPLKALPVPSAVKSISFSPNSIFFAICCESCVLIIDLQNPDKRAIQIPEDASFCIFDTTGYILTVKHDRFISFYRLFIEDDEIKYDELSKDFINDQTIGAFGQDSSYIVLIGDDDRINVFANESDSE